MVVDEKQAAIIADALLEPGLKAQRELRLKRNFDVARITARRRYAAWALVGMAIGGLVGHFALDRFAAGFIIGGITAYLLARFARRSAV